MAANAAGLNKQATYRLTQAVDEIATNAIVHGYSETDQEGTLTVQAETDENILMITLEDTGSAYDPTQAVPPESRRIGGLGLYLAMQGVDRLLYERVGDRNRNIFIVNRTEPSSGKPD